MSRYAEQVQNALPRIRARLHKADSLEAIVPMVLASAVLLADGDTAKGRQVASMAAPLAEFSEVRPWVAGMTTDPGDMVQDPDGKRVYIFTGKVAQTHSNPLFFPGATGVYYWAIVPDMQEGAKVFPDVSGIVVYVRKDELWWNPTQTKRYRWTGDSYDCPANYYPGAAGVHQWKEAPE